MAPAFIFTAGIAAPSTLIEQIIKREFGKSQYYVESYEVTGYPIVIAHCRARDTTQKDIVIKVPLNAAAENRLSVAYQNLQAIHQALDASPKLRQVIPTPLLRGRIESISYFIERRIKGISGAQVEYASTPFSQLVARAIDFITEFHRNTLSELPSEKFFTVVERKTCLVGKVYTEPWTTRIIARLLDFVKSRVRQNAVSCVYSHNDFVTKNLLLDPETLRLTGVIDWDYAEQFGIPGIDVFHLLCHAGKTRYGSLRVSVERALFGSSPWVSELYANYAVKLGVDLDWKLMIPLYLLTLLWRNAKSITEFGVCGQYFESVIKEQQEIVTLLDKVLRNVE